MHVDVRVLSLDELHTLVGWAEKEGWNPGLHDTGIFHAADPTGYFGAFVEDELFGGISAIRYDPTFGFIGFFIVRPGYRGRRVGPAMADKALAHLAGRNIGIDGVEEKLQNYTNLYGFKLAHRNIRFEGVASESMRIIQPDLLPASYVPFDQLEAYDRQCFPAKRPSFLSQWVTSPQSSTLVATAHRAVEGFGTIRPCGIGHKIGPLFADSFETAEKLLLGLVSTLPHGGQFYLDVPATNPLALALTKKHSMQSVFRTARMYTQEAPKIDLHKVFGVTSFELG